MLSISVKVRGLEQFPGQPELRDAIRQSIRRSGELILVTAEANVGRFMHTRSGKLRRGFQLRVRESGPRFVVTVKNTVFYAHMLEGGVRPHKIPGGLTRNERWVGARQKVLRFTVGGKTIFARAVQHPGIRPRRWFAGSVHEALPELQRIFEQELGAVITSRQVTEVR
jgi:hypothetical protein